MDDAKKRAVILAVSVTQFTMPFMFSAVGVALPAIGHEFGATGIDLSLVESIYIGGIAALLLPFGRYSDMHGRQPVFRMGVLLYAIFTLLLGFTQDINTVIFLRLAQGISGALAIATNMALLTESVPLRERGKAMGLAVAAVYIGLSAGPYIGGLVTTHMGWRWLFFLGTIPLGISYIVAYRNLKEKFCSSDEKFDYSGSMMVIFSVAALVFGGTNLSAGWPGVALLLSGLVGFAIFIFMQGRAKFPLVELTLFKERKDFSDAAFVQFISYAGTFGIVFLFSLYLQSVKAMTPHETGVVLVVQPIVQAVLSPLCGRLADRFYPRIIAMSGMIVCTAGSIMGACVGAETSLAYLYMMFVVLGVGFALFSAPNMIILMGSVPPSRFGFASAITGALRTIGMVASMVIIAIFLSMFMGDVIVSPESAVPYMRVMHYSLVTLSGLCVIGVVISMRQVYRRFYGKSEVAKQDFCVQSAVSNEEN
ncbi:MAG: MFS transporter [Desulfovibrio sp. S3730MH75]|nr:MAG: MFS transporter [Desulfovibrio sp. S3730MH75]